MYCQLTRRFLHILPYQNLTPLILILDSVDKYG